MDGFFWFLKTFLWLSLFTIIGFVIGRIWRFLKGEEMKRKKKDGSCYIVRCQGDAEYWIDHPEYKPQHVCGDCRDYMKSRLKWRDSTLGV